MPSSTSTMPPLALRLCPGLKGEKPFIDWDVVRRRLLPDTIHGQATGKTYQFTTLQELFDVVPGDHMRECFAELGEALHR